MFCIGTLLLLLLDVLDRLVLHLLDAAVVLVAVGGDGLLAVGGELGLPVAFAFLLLLELVLLVLLELGAEVGFVCVRGGSVRHEMLLEVSMDQESSSFNVQGQYVDLPPAVSFSNRTWPVVNGRNAAALVEAEKRGRDERARKDMSVDVWIEEQLNSILSINFGVTTVNWQRTGYIGEKAAASHFLWNPRVKRNGDATSSFSEQPKTS
jgi:hypothetical protein